MIPAFESIEGVAYVEVLSGAQASDESPIELLIEVPHGADERKHYDALRSQLKSELPKDLHVYFHVNTDIGAWAYGRRVAEQVLLARPRARALLIRCLVPRTFVDTNRELTAPDQLAQGGLSGAIAPYIDQPEDHALLGTLHGRYVGLIDAAYDVVCGSGGMALSPHTYGPYFLPIEKIDADIVEALRHAHAPEVVPTLRKRAEIDLLTDTKEGQQLADPRLTDAIEEELTGAGYQVVRNEAYRLLPGSQTYRQSLRHPQKVFCLEVRRDLLVQHYQPLDAMALDTAAVDRLAGPLAGPIRRWLEAAERP